MPAKLGVNLDDLLISQPDTGEQALEITETLVRSGALDVIVVDSVAALVPKAEIEGDMGDSHVGLQARLMSQALRKLTGAISRSNTCVIFINQLRMKIGVMFGSPETTTGGNALKFYASVRMDIRRIETLKDGQDAIGIRARVKVIKNKVAPPFRQAEFDIMYNEGISVSGSVLDVATDLGIVRKSGAWFYLSEERLGQGRENAKTFLKANPDVLDDIRNRIKAASPELSGRMAFDGSAEEELEELELTAVMPRPALARLTSTTTRDSPTNPARWLYAATGPGSFARWEDESRRPWPASRRLTVASQAAL